MKNALTTHVELNHFNDQELVKRIQNGDIEAFTPLVCKYQRKIQNLIYQQVHDEETAKDLCQDVFLKAWQALPKFEGRSKFYSWLHQIAINCSIDFLRKQKKEIIFACEELPQNPDDILQMTRTQLSPCQLFEREELRHIIYKAISQLPPGQRCVFNLRYFHELSIKKIASRLNKSESTIKAHLHYARGKLQNMLRPYLQNEPLEW